LLILSLAVMVVTGMAVRSAYTLHTISGMREAVGQSTQRLLVNYSLWSAMQDAENAQRGYLLTGEPDYLAPYDESIRRAESDHQQLAALYADAPDRMALVGEIGVRMTEKLAQLTATISVYQAHGTAQALALTRGANGRDPMEQLRAGTARLREMERSSLAVRGETVRKQVRAALLQTAATVVGVFALTLLALWLQRRESAARIAAQMREQEATRRLSDAHADLQRSHEAFVRSLREALFDYEVDAGVVHWGADFEAITGDTPAGFGPWLEDWQRRVHPDDLPEVRRLARRAIETGGLLEAEYRLLHADGTWRWVNVRAVTQSGPAGKVTRLVGTMRDISPLHEARAQLDLALWAADIAFWRVDLDSARYETSYAWASQLGYSPGEAPATRAEWAELIHPDDRARVLAHVRDVDERRIERYDAEFRLRHRDGSYRWFLSRGVPQLDAEGRVRSLIGIRIDVTAAHRSQQALERERTRIARRIDDEPGQAMHRLKLDLGWLDQRVEALEASLPLHQGGAAGEIPASIRLRIAAMQAFLDASIDAVERISAEVRAAPAGDADRTTAGDRG
jgi:PAS domain S-box-containing protein